tara:strand:+ start:4954 stop:5148 length:195 start_codon:yes stop_codon:yes gene_type:complete
MKKFILFFLLIAICIMIFNIYKIDWNKSLINENSIALIGVLASGCAILLLLILNLSVKISEKEK